MPVKINVAGAVLGAIAIGLLAGACLPAGSDADSPAVAAEANSGNRSNEPQRFSAAEPSSPMGR